MSSIFNKFKKDIWGIFWLSSAIFIALSLFSYRPGDPSFNSISNGAMKVGNFCGLVGSFLSDLLYQLLGISSWIFVIGFIVLGINYLKGMDINFKSLKLLWLGILLLTCSSLLSLYLDTFSLYGGKIFVGGSLGKGVAFQLEKILNTAGVGIFLWACLVIMVLFITEKPLNYFLQIPGRIFGFSYIHGKSYLHRFVFPIEQKFKEKIKKKLIKLFSRKELNYTTNEPEIYDSKNLYANDDFEQEKAASSVQLFLKPMKKEKTTEAIKRKKIKLKTRIQHKIENWELPNLTCLEDPPDNAPKIDEKELYHKTHLLEDKLQQFNVKGKVSAVRPGPAVTMFEFKPNIDVKISKITDLADDLSLALSSESVRIIAPIPGRDVVGIETSNSIRETVYLKEILADEEFWSEDKKLPMALGKQADGSPQIVDLRKMPHLMVAGTTGSGKSVFVVSCLTGLLFKHSPKTLKLILVDPKQVDLAAFHKIPHLLMPPICETKKAVNALKWAVKEMEKRYRSMSKFGARNIEEFNVKISKLTKEQIEEHEEVNLDYQDNSRRFETYHYTPQPYTVIVVEEFGDLMTVDKNNVENLVVRLAQMARASGMHLVLAMQSPRKDVVTGLIKTNIPGRISFKVASKMDSRIILDEGGAERLLARGDMLFLAPGVIKPQRHHGPFLTEDEITTVTKYWSDQSEPEYDDEAMQMLEGSGGGMGVLYGDEEVEEQLGPDKEERYDEILSWVADQKNVSASLLQRKFRLGYPRAARLIEIFESEGVVGPANGSKPREVLVKSYE